LLIRRFVRFSIILTSIRILLRAINGCFVLFDMIEGAEEIAW